jgi:hypothetical protein
LKASPAPVVSTTGPAFAAGTSSDPPGPCSSAPRAPSVTTAAPAPRAISASAAAFAVSGPSTQIPVNASASVSFGVTQSHKASTASGRSRPGAGFSTVVTPAARAISSPRTAASSGCSSWVTKTAAAPISPACAWRSAGAMVAAAPGQMMMALSPLASSMKM